MSPPSVGRWNRAIGWGLILAGLVGATWLDPWSLSLQDSHASAFVERMTSRHAQAVAIGMGFLQLLVAELAFGRRPTAFLAAVLTAAGALVYTAGFALGLVWPGGIWLAPVGAILNFSGFLALLGAPSGRAAEGGVRSILFVLCVGMLLDLVMALFHADPVTFRPDYLGADDGVRLRMLRLARAAVTALSVVAYLYHGLAVRAGNDGWPRVGQVAVRVGAFTMPAVLAVAAFSNLWVKYLLPIPALTTFTGVCIGGWLAVRHARRLEVWGWVLIGVSMGAGLLMGLYAFDGPLPTPEFLGGYNDWPRRLERYGHAYVIVFGMLCIILSRRTAPGATVTWTTRFGEALVAAGGAATPLAVLSAAADWLPVAFLVVGPAAVAAGTLLCLAVGGPSGPARRTEEDALPLYRNVGLPGAAREAEKGRTP